MRWSLLILCIVGLAACETQDTQETGTLFTNLNGYTMSEDGLVRFSELWVEDRAVKAIGQGELKSAHPTLDVHDLGGRTVLPGLIDAHGHVSSLGRGEEQIELAGSPSLDQALGRIQAFAKANPDAPWLLGRGWNQELWSGSEFPSRADLDAIVSDRPILLNRIDGHAAWANSVALERAGINRDTEDPDGGRLLRDSTGEPTGILVDAAMSLAEAVIAQPTTADTERHIVTGLKRLASLGITSAHDAGASVQEVGVFRSLAERQQLAVRVYVMLAGAGDVLDAIATPLIDDADGMLSIRSVKLYADGALGSRGAALIDDYSDEPGHKGLLFVDVHALTAMVTKSNQAGFQANVHAIGDLANQVVLDAFERSAAATNTQLRNRIEHAQVLTLADIERMKALDIIASMQPTHATSDKNMAETRLGAERMAGAYAWQRMLKLGIVVAAGSDFPVEPANPMFGLHAAVTRKDRNGKPVDGWYAPEAMTREQALRAFTMDAAYAAHQEDQLGQLAPGYLADFIVIDNDFFTMPADDIWKIKVEATWVNGRQVYAREENN